MDVCHQTPVNKHLRALLDNQSMHLLIPYATSHADACQAVLPSLKLPHLQKLLSRLTAQALDAGEELSFSPPHERAQAISLGLTRPDGLIPWAALQAQKQAELVKLGGAWAFVTLCNWQVNTHQVTMRQIPMQGLSQQESDQFLAAMRPFFKEDGITLYPFEPGCWLAHAEVFDELVTASADRVLGRDLTPWMPRHPLATSLVRLMSEMQMLLYTHPVNDAREAIGALPVNAFWLSGTGALSENLTKPPASQPRVVTTLRDAALRDDWQSWAQAWKKLDQDEGRAMLGAHSKGEAVGLTFCSERHSQTWLAQPQALTTLFLRLFGSQCIQDVLKIL